MHNEPVAMTQAIASLLERFHASRKYSTDLILHLSPEDCQAQSMDDASPAKWHLAHVTWFYEVMVLKQFEPSFEFWNPHYAVLFNSYYNGVGDKHPRPKRGLLTRPSLTEVLEWRRNIDQRVITLLSSDQCTDCAWLIELGINHEQQHQELLLTDIQHLFFNNSLYPAYSPGRLSAVERSGFEWVSGSSGLQEVGYTGPDFHFDNESPRHTTFLQPHAISNSLIKNHEWLAFIHSGGYEQSCWWLDEGWAWVQRERITAPLYWIQSGDNLAFSRFSLGGQLPLDLGTPVTNISYFEADAFARWASESIPDYAGARLPTEFEWEVFAQTHQQKSHDLFGVAWQWTRSPYSAYPGYQPWGGIAGEYNGKFMVNQMVLRGSSAYTTTGHSRLSYRNFFPTHARWQMTGLRLARDSG